jgi:type I restriction enzyme S subunit
MYWVLNSGVFYGFISFHGTGTTIKHLYQNVFEVFQFPTPPIQEQQQIASYLDHKTTQIDTLIEKKKRLIDLLKEERTAVINQAVTQGLDPNVPFKDSGVEWLGEIPEHWDVTYIKRISSPNKDSVVDGPFGSSVNVNTDYVDDGVPVIRTINITDNGFSEENLKFMRVDKFNMLKRHAVYPNDVVLSKVGTIGNCCLFPSHIKEAILSTTGSCKITLNLDIVAPNYIIFLFRSMREHFHLLASSNVQPFLNMETIKNIKLPLPPSPEQEYIISYLEKETSRINTIITKAEREIELLQEYRTALISEVVTGKIDVRDWKEPE